MSITLDNVLDSNQTSVFEPCIIDGTTTRWPFDVAGDRIDQTITATAANSTRTQLTISDSSLYQAGDTVEYAGGTQDFAQFNGQHSVHSIVNATNLVIDYTFPGSAPSTGTKGTLRKLNHGLHIQVSTTGDNMIRVPVVSNNADGVGYFRCDFRRVLQALVDLPIAFTTGLKSVANCEYDDDIVLTEYFKDENNAFKAGSSDTILAGSYIAHDITKFDKDDGWLFYRNPVVAGALLHVRVYAPVTLATPDVYLHILGYKANGQSLLSSLVAQVVTTNHILYVYEVPSAEVVRLVINLFQNYTVSPEPIINPVDLLVIPACDRTRWLYFRNRFGGFSTVAFHDYTSSRRATKAGDYTGKAEVIETLYGYPITHNGETTTGNVYGDLITSPEVYKEDGVQVFVEMDEGLQAAEGEEAEIVIRYEVYQAI